MFTASKRTRSSWSQRVSVWRLPRRSPSFTFARPRRSGPMYRAGARGGVPSLLTQLDKSLQDLGHTGPSFLPDDAHFVYLRRSRVAEQSGAYTDALEGVTAQP